MKRKPRLAKRNFSLLVWPAFIIALVVLFDQAAKIWAINSLSGQPSVSVLGEFFRLTLVYNEGGAMGTNFGSSTWYLIIALIIIPILFYYLYLYRTVRSFALPLAFICGGAIGNLVDRIRIGRVVDFLDVDFFDITIFGLNVDRWWTFNIADAAISCALVFLLIRMIFYKPVPVQSAGQDQVNSPSTQTVE